MIRERDERHQPFGDRPDPLLTVNEVAAILRLSKMTVYRFIHGGEIRSILVGRSYRIPESALNEFVESGYYRPTEPDPDPGTSVS